MQGTVIKNTGSWYQVRCDSGEAVDCKIKGNFRLKDIKSTNPVAVGDRVTILRLTEGPSFIVDILPRKNYIVRRSSNLSKQSHILASNIDLCFLIVTINHPVTSPTFIDRFLASAEAYGIKVVPVFNKIDIYSSVEIEKTASLVALYSNIGYQCLQTSTKTGEGIEDLKKLMLGKISLLAGNSGVGKSSMINAINPAIKVKTGDISLYHNKGMHTTTYSEMFEILPQSYLVDTPGIKGFGTYDMKAEEISHYFVEIFNMSNQCKYNNCTHTHEPGCAVVSAVERGEIVLSRYNSYLSMLEDEQGGKYRDAE